MNEEEKVYAVTAGCYSDYRVIAVFTSAELAEEFMATVPSGDDYGGYNKIEEFHLNPKTSDLIKRGYAHWQIFMLRDGSVERAVLSDVDSGLLECEPARIWERSKSRWRMHKDKPDCLKANVWAKNEASAVKIANEYRIRMIALGEWKS